MSTVPFYDFQYQQLQQEKPISFFMTTRNNSVIMNIL